MGSGNETSNGPVTILWLVSHNNNYYYYCDLIGLVWELEVADIETIQV